jgi:hypothetical protein
MLLGSGLTGTPGLSNVDRTTFVILNGTKETDEIPRREACSFDVTSCWQPADVVEVWSDKGQQGHQCRFLFRGVLHAQGLNYSGIPVP